MDELTRPRPAGRPVAEPGGTDWSLLPTLVVRSTGFPWQVLDGLAFTESAEALAELVRLERAAAAVVAVTPFGGRLTRGARARLRNLRPLPEDAPVDPVALARWNALTGRIEGLRKEVTAAVERDAGSVQEALRRLAADERFLDAVACSSPAAFRDLRRGARGARIRRQIAAYAQRFCAKCETMSFFGPINYGRVEPDLTGPARMEWSGHRNCPERRAFTAARVGDALQAALLAHPAAAGRLVPRRKTWAGPVPAGGDPLVPDVVGRADGRRDVTEIAALLDVPVRQVAAATATAMRRGLLTHRLCPPATTTDPLGWVRERLAAEPFPGAEELTGSLDELIALLDAHPGAPPERKVELQGRVAALAAGWDAAATGPREPGAGDAARGTGSRFYNDRVIVHEAAVGTLRVTVGGDLARDLRGAVGSVLDLLAHDAELTRLATNRALAGHLGRGRFPLVTAMRRSADLPIRHSGWLAELIGAALAEAGPDAAEVDLAGRAAAPPPAAPVLCSVDVMAGTDDLARYRSGETPLVLGDIHDAALLTPWALQFHPEGAARLAERDAAVRAALGGTRALSVVGRRTTGLPPLEFPGLVLELGGTSGGTAARVALDELYVDSDGERAELRAAGVPEPLMFHNGELDTGFHTALALPRIRRPRPPRAARLPRIRLGNVVLLRRRWTVTVDALPAPVADDGERLAAMARFRNLVGLPRRFFAKSAAERKPIYVDTASPVLLDGLARLAAGAAELDLSEVLPDPDGLWLRDGDLRFAAELRCVYLRPAETAERS
ncbi:lantibiotic dehydratase [Actinomadura craniellae]|uniref:Lantibiotic dehydratase n=1 Tax=Actinomadura craniellae TaxID=2231787 RepID=A0A365HB38_9ACTN|nr:lantibiotic dehydratase [Actinomadura craniellae]RAY16146.1 lantibiotic dehydratase [Actinomadura craniellae]